MGNNCSMAEVSFQSDENVPKRDDDGCIIL